MDKSLQTAFHRLVLNESGANFYEANFGDELPEEGYTGECHWHVMELLQIVDFVNEHRDYFQKQSETLWQTWRTVADEVIDHMEAQEKGSAVKDDIPAHLDFALMQLAGVWTEDERELYRKVQEGELGPEHLPTPKSFAGKWYQSFNLSEKHYEAFHRQDPMLQRVLYWRKRERFPEVYGKTVEEHMAILKSMHA